MIDMSEIAKPKLTITSTERKYTEYQAPKTLGIFGSGRARSGSFSQSFQAFHGDKLVGSAQIEHHTNNPKYVAFPEAQRPDEMAARTPNLPTTYLSRIDNFTVGDHQPTKGVGSTLMGHVESTAREAGAQKLTLLPAPGTIKKARFPAEQMASMDIPEHTKFENIKFNPTRFYEHVGFHKDHQEQHALVKQYRGFIPEEELLAHSEKRTSHMSKML